MPPAVAGYYAVLAVLLFICKIQRTYVKEGLHPFAINTNTTIWYGVQWLSWQSIKLEALVQGSPPTELLCCVFEQENLSAKQEIIPT